MIGRTHRRPQCTRAISCHLVPVYQCEGCYRCHDDARDAMAHHRDAQDDLRTEAMSGKMAAIGNDEVKTTFQMFFYLTEKIKKLRCICEFGFRLHREPTAPIWLAIWNRTLAFLMNRAQWLHMVAKSLVTSCHCFSHQVWISKFSSHSGVCSRRRVKELVLQGSTRPPFGAFC